MEYTVLDYKGFEEYLVEESSNTLFGGLHYEFKFPNEYGASVVKHSTSYGANYDLFELAVLDSYGYLCYTTKITDDVLGYLNNNDVLEILEKIMNL